MSRIEVSGPVVSGDVGHFRVSITAEDRVVEFEPTFSLLGLSNLVHARNTAKQVCEETARALVQARVPLGDVMQVIGRLWQVATVSTLTGLGVAA